jgi:hypothetical protein
MRKPWPKARPVCWQKPASRTKLASAIAPKEAPLFPVILDIYMRIAKLARLLHKRKLSSSNHRSPHEKLDRSHYATARFDDTRARHA